MDHGDLGDIRVKDSLEVARGIFELNVIGFVLLVIAAVLLIGVAEGVAGKNKSHV